MIFPDREGLPKAVRSSQKEIAEGSFGAGRLMAGTDWQQVSTYSCVKG